MATAKIQLTDTWQLVAADGANFVVDNGSSYNVQVTFSESAPAVDAAYHVLGAGQGLVRMSLTGGIYARASDADDNSFLIVTT